MFTFPDAVVGRSRWRRPPASAYACVARRRSSQRSTGGESPALSSWLRRRFEGELGPEYGLLLTMLRDEREAVRAAGRSTEGLDWHRALDSGMLDLIREGRLAEAKERLQACLSSSSG